MRKILRDEVRNLNFNLELSRALFLKVINSVFYAIEVEKLILEFDSYAIICLVEIVTS